MTHRKTVSAHKMCVKSHKEKRRFQNKKVILWRSYSTQNLGFDAQKFGKRAQKFLNFKYN